MISYYCSAVTVCVSFTFSNQILVENRELFLPHLHSTTRLRVTDSDLGWNAGYKKTGMMRLLDA